MTFPDPAPPAMTPVDLTCEYISNPLGIDTLRPRLCWNLESNRRAEKQTGFQILAASSESALKANHGDLWDSGKVASDESLHFEYAGKPLVSGQRCLWKVRVWNRDGKPSAYSAPTSWEMGLLQPGDWHGKWIGRTADTAYQPAPLLRRAFTINGKVRRARLYICGLGYCDVRLNGLKVGDHELDPGYTRYDRRDLYVTHDVTGLLHQGKNALGVMLGTGWQNVHTRAVWYFDKAPWRAAPKLLAELRIEYTDGRTEVVASDETWKTATGPIIFDSIYGGETYDAQQERPAWDLPGFDDSSWTPAIAVEAPKGLLRAQQSPPIRIKQTLKPVRVTEPKPGVFLFDLGQNLAGWAELRVKGPAGTNVIMKYGEKLHADGTLDQSNLNPHLIKTDPPQRFQTDEYILKGEGEEVWHARFCYHGFQYVEVTGFPGTPTVDNLRGLFIHTDVQPVGEFSCSNPLLNRIQEATHWSYLSNMQGIPTDCPHREKNGWTGDAHLAAEQGLFNFASAAFYTKWLNDLKDEMRETGELPGIVPSSGWGYEWGNGPAWDSAYPLIAWYLYEYCGDKRILEVHYDHLKRYVDYLTSRASDGIVSIGLGDWVPYKTETPVEVTSTGYYYRDALIVAKAADLLGKKEDGSKYARLAETIQSAFNAKFRHPENGLYSNGGQTALGCSLYQGLAPVEKRGEVLDRLVTAVDKNNGHIDTGILGAKYVLNALTDMGRADVAYRIATQKTLPGWGYWFERGATTLWESWGGEGDSRNHIMFGDISAWMYKALAGINPDPNAPGFKHFIIKPNIVGDLTHAQAAYRSIRGLIVSDWKLEGGKLRLSIQIPANATATVFIPTKPGAVVTESGKSIDKAVGVRFLRNEPGWSIYNVGSGKYEFAAER